MFLALWLLQVIRTSVAPAFATMGALMLLALWLLQAPAEGAADNTTPIRWVAGVLALAVVVIIFVRRKRKASKQDWT